MSVIKIKTKEEFDQFVQSHKIVIVYVSAEWCGPCKVMSRRFDEHATENLDIKDKVAFIEFDIDENPDLAQELGIQDMPTFAVYEDYKRLDYVPGANPPALKKMVQGAVERFNDDTRLFVC